MRHLTPKITFSEVPRNVSLAIQITGCDMRCNGCHSPELRDASLGKELTGEIYSEYLRKNKNLATCILFLGGEWYQEKLSEYLAMARLMGYNTALYTGRRRVDKSITDNLDFIKTGAFFRYPLNDPRTNQRFIDLRSGEDATYLFWTDFGNKKAA